MHGLSIEERFKEESWYELAERLNNYRITNVHEKIYGIYMKIAKDATCTFPGLKDSDMDCITEQLVGQYQRRMKR